MALMVCILTWKAHLIRHWSLLLPHQGIESDDEAQANIEVDQSRWKKCGFHYDLSVCLKDATLNHKCSTGSLSHGRLLKIPT